MFEFRDVEWENGEYQGVAVVLADNLDQAKYILSNLISQSSSLTDIMSYGSIKKYIDGLDFNIVDGPIGYLFEV